MICIVILSALFVILWPAAIRKKRRSVYQDEPWERNPLEGKRVSFIPDLSEKENADGVKGRLEAVGNSKERRSIYDRIIKRVIDCFLALCALVVLLPVFLILSAAVYLDDPGPVFFVQKRAGRRKQFFRLHKFRTMKLSAPHDIPTHMLKNTDRHITRVGRFLRKSSLDELPQIWDILLGNMSFIGPRPALWNQELLLAERDRYGANDIRPGLTGWAQINGRDQLTLFEKARLDGVYVEKESILFDLRCFVGTIFSAIRADGVTDA